MGTGGRQRATRARTMAPGGREGRTGAEERRLLRHSSPVHDPASLVKLCPSETAAPNGSDGLLLNAVLVMRGSRGHGRWDVKEPVISSCFQGVVIVNAGQKDAHSQICFQLLCLFLKKHQNKSEKSCLHYFLFYFCHFYHSWGKIKKNAKRRMAWESSFTCKTWSSKISCIHSQSTIHCHWRYYNSVVDVSLKHVVPQISEKAQSILPRFKPQLCGKARSCFWSLQASVLPVLLLFSHFPGVRDRCSRWSR